MNRIRISQPVFSDGDAYFSLDTNLAKEEHLFIDCDYRKKNRRAFKYMFYASGTEVRRLPMHNKKFYKLYLKDLEKVFYYFTISWDGEEDNDERTYIRYNFNDMIECIVYYIDSWQLRGAELECCAVESSKKSYLKDLTKEALEAINKQHREAN